MSWFWPRKADDSRGAITQISVHDLKTKLDDDNSLLLIDVRTQEEFDEARVPQIKARIDYFDIAEKIDIERFPKDKTIYLICRAGRRSMVAARILTEIGYRDLVNVAGGTSKWIEASYPVIKR